MKTTKSNTTFFSDACHICQVVKKSDQDGIELTYEELQTAFTKVKQKNEKEHV